MEDLDDLEDEDEAQEEHGAQNSTQSAAGHCQRAEEGGAMKEEAEDEAESRGAASAGRDGSSTGAGTRKRPRKAEGDEPAAPASTVTLSDVAKLPFDPSFTEHIKVRRPLGPEPFHYASRSRLLTWGGGSAADSRRFGGRLDRGAVQPQGPA